MVLKRLLWQENCLRGLLKDVDLMWYMLKLKIMTGEEPTASRFEITAKKTTRGHRVPPGMDSVKPKTVLSVLR